MWPTSSTHICIKEIKTQIDSEILCPGCKSIIRVNFTSQEIENTCENCNNNRERVFPFKLHEKEIVEWRNEIESKWRLFRIRKY